MRERHLAHERKPSVEAVDVEDSVVEKATKKQGYREQAFTEVERAVEILKLPGRKDITVEGDRVIVRPSPERFQGLRKDKEPPEPIADFSFDAYAKATRELGKFDPEQVVKAKAKSLELQENVDKEESALVAAEQRAAQAREAVLSDRRRQHGDAPLGEGELQDALRTLEERAQVGLSYRDKRMDLNRSIGEWTTANRKGYEVLYRHKMSEEERKETERWLAEDEAYDPSKSGALSRLLRRFQRDSRTMVSTRGAKDDLHDLQKRMEQEGYDGQLEQIELDDAKRLAAGGDHQAAVLFADRRYRDAARDRDDAERRLRDAKYAQSEWREKHRLELAIGDQLKRP